MKFNRFINSAVKIIKYTAIYYLSVKMIVFAIAKILRLQFTIPYVDSYTPLAELSGHQHMWSFFGRSYSYNLFIAISELLIGILIVSKKTRLVALLLCFTVCLNVAILSFGFNIYFAQWHAVMDLLITMAFLSHYVPDLYKFFIQNEGKIYQTNKNKTATIKLWLPYIIIITLTSVYFIFWYNYTSPQTSNKIAGAYEVKSIKINDSTIYFKKGKVGIKPMLFLEQYNAAVFSIEDSIYYGSYYQNNDTLRIAIKNPAIKSMEFMNGIIKNDSIIAGKTRNNESDFQLFYKRISSKHNYLNGL
ncbi:MULTISPECIES: hypothetical protein [Galbibacter]|uniref:DoxX family protein n=1 Tax=Galbibacter pacificus TaxID=2996052 RepID=A0ABT6FQU5_9FLAO|nr:hypothetical protein [Galbibacter pacificus]MDG3581884.1 hypothetical protein [Galbibacter pacificus]MDG3585642.1 hypothetical protein [Galbibacter pacificus]